MKRLKWFTGFILLLTLTTSCFASANKWWANINIAPEQAKLNKIAPEYFNENWVYASFISFGDIKSLVDKKDYLEFIQTKYSFAKVIDLNGNKEDEAIRLGVYRDINNNTGIFLSVIENEKLLKVISKETSRSFSVLLSKGDEIRWYHCMDCDDYTKLIWNGSSYILQKK